MKLLPPPGNHWWNCSLLLVVPDETTLSCLLWGSSINFHCVPWEIISKLLSTKIILIKTLIQRLAEMRNRDAISKQPLSPLVIFTNFLITINWDAQLTQCGRGNNTDGFSNIRSIQYTVYTVVDECEKISGVDMYTEYYMYRVMNKWWGQPRYSIIYPYLPNHISD